MSTAAGIPDFRSKAGLFEEIAKEHNLTRPEDFFSLALFRKNPELLYKFMSKMDLDQYEPTKTHYFIAELEKEGLLDTVYTQNVDGLELKAGVSPEKMVQFHGSVTSASCIGCHKAHSIEEVKEKALKDEVLFCECKAPVKPDFVLYGEPINTNNIKRAMDIQKAEVVLILGTSLNVSPFNQMAYATNPNCHRVLINLEKVGQEGKGGFDFDSPYSNDMFLKGEIDSVIEQMRKDLGWTS